MKIKTMKKIYIAILGLLVLGIVFTAAKAKLSLRQRVMAQETIYFVPANIEPSMAKLFVHAVGQRDIPFIPEGFPVLSENIETQTLLIRGETFDDFNKQVFKSLKKILGDRLKWIPQEYVQIKDNKGKKYYEYDFTAIPYTFIIEANYMTRRSHDALYLLMSADDIYKEGTLIKPSSMYDLSLTLIEKTKQGTKGKVRVEAKHKLIGVHHGVYGEGAEVLGTIQDKEHQTDYFRWSPKYITDRTALENDFKAYIEFKRPIVEDRERPVIPDFIDQLNTAFEK